MTKRRKNKRKPKGLDKPNLENKLLSWPWRRRLLIFDISLGVLALVCLIYGVSQIYSLDTILKKIPLAVRLVYFAILFSFGPIRFLILKKLKQAELIAGDNVEYIQNLYLIRAFYTSFWLVLFAFPLIFVSSINNYLAVYLNSRIPSLGVTFNKVIFDLLSILVSGVIGNAAYDVLKRIRRRFK